MSDSTERIPTTHLSSYPPGPPPPPGGYGYAPPPGPAGGPPPATAPPAGRSRGSLILLGLLATVLAVACGVLFVRGNSEADRVEEAEAEADELRDELAGVEDDVEQVEGERDDALAEIEPLRAERDDAVAAAADAQISLDNANLDLEDANLALDDAIFLLDEWELQGEVVNQNTAVCLDANLDFIALLIDPAAIPQAEAEAAADAFGAAGENCSSLLEASDAMSALLP